MENPRMETYPDPPPRKPSSTLSDRTLRLALVALLGGMSGMISGCGDPEGQRRASQKKANSCLESLTEKEIGRAREDCSTNTFLISNLRGCEDRLDEPRPKSRDYDYNIEKQISFDCNRDGISPDAEHNIAAMKKLNELRDDFKKARIETCGSDDCEETINEKRIRLKEIISLHHSGIYMLSSPNDIDEGIILASELNDKDMVEKLLIYKRKLPQDKNWKARVEDSSD